ncbi:MAG: transcription antitermination factor NusB [Bacteroidetes bacterium]|nr:transcription antitermination factor NusB [Bacteroidota bacterium]
MSTYTSSQGDEAPIPRIETDEVFENDPERDKHLARRRIARERVMQAIYAHVINERDTDEIFFEMVSSDPLLAEQGIEFARQLMRAYNQHKNELNEIISRHLAHWDVSRVALVDRILIQIGILEFKYFPEVPPKATINELIEIAKDFSTEESGKFINGILHAIKEDLTKSGDMKKEGRGLLEQSL